MKEIVTVALLTPKVKNDSYNDQFENHFSPSSALIFERSKDLLAAIRE
jgi:hypothetical protein